MKEKKEFWNLLTDLVVIGMLLAGFVICVDPFYQYHKVWFGLPVILENAVYQTPGAARNLSYDSVIIGTSMTENFHASWFDELGWNTVKLSYSGARTNDLQAILTQVFSREEAPAHVLMDINHYQLTVPAQTAYVKRPDNLYDTCVLNDVSYLYNHDSLRMSIQRIVDKLQGRESNLDTAYTWEDSSLFGAQIARNAAWNDRKLALESAGQTVDLKELLRCCDENLDQLTPFIEAHPETEFYIFYPPYSMLYWEQRKYDGTLDEILMVYQHSMERFLSYENVQVYDFQTETNIISNLDNYRDAAHHKPEWNYYIFECIRDEKNRVTKENLSTYIGAMYKYANEFDYDALWEDDSPL